MTASNHKAREAQFNRLLALWRALPAFRGDCSERTFWQIGGGVGRVRCRAATQRAAMRSPSTRQPLGESTLDFLRLAIRRCRASVHGAWLGAAVYVIQLAAVVLLGWRYGGPEASLAAILGSWPLILSGWVGLPVYLAFRFWYVARKRAEIGAYCMLERELSNASSRE